VKIAIVVQGRFHAFDLARALLARGHDVTLFTNYPRWAVERFGFPGTRTRSFWTHGVISRGADRICALTTCRPERFLNPLFGRWAAHQLQNERWDVIYAWSGVSEEVLLTHENRGSLNLVIRGSAHIRSQDLILKEEEQRTGRRRQRPGRWIRHREAREYELAHRVVVLSRFAHNSFVAEGLNPAKLWLLPLGANTEVFRPAPSVIAARCRRILSGQPLTVLYVGALSLRKGLWDAETIVRSLGTERFRFRFVGPVSPEARSLARSLGRIVEVVPKQRQQDLPAWYSESDLFLFPTIEDGFAVVLAQAQANALPILTTSNCSGPDFIDDGVNGWVLPIRSPEAFAQRLAWCDVNRPVLADMVRASYTRYQVRDWNSVAADFEALYGLEQGRRSQQLQSHAANG
jgi:glycosyltransferase involved in cell wall biosynthesis